METVGAVHPLVKAASRASGRYDFFRKMIQQVCGSVTDATDHHLNPPDKPAREYWEQHRILWCRLAGPSLRCVAPDVESPILELAGEVLTRGLRKMCTT
jgi:hypothetical protein